MQSSSSANYKSEFFSLQSTGCAGIQQALHVSVRADIVATGIIHVCCVQFLKLLSKASQVLHLARSFLNPGKIHPGWQDFVIILAGSCQRCSTWELRHQRGFMQFLVPISRHLYCANSSSISHTFGLDWLHFDAFDGNLVPFRQFCWSKFEASVHNYILLQSVKVFFFISRTQQSPKWYRINLEEITTMSLSMLPIYCIFVTIIFFCPPFLVEWLPGVFCSV